MALLLEDSVQECDGIKKGLRPKLVAAELGVVRDAWRFKQAIGGDVDEFVRAVQERTLLAGHPIQKNHRCHLRKLYQYLDRHHAQLVLQEQQETMANPPMAPAQMNPAAPPVHAVFGQWTVPFERLIEMPVKSAPGIGQAIGNGFRLQLGITKIGGLLRFFTHACGSNMAFFVLQIHNLLGVNAPHWHHLFHCAAYLLHISALMAQAAVVAGNAAAIAVILLFSQNIAIGGGM
ncbi:hypothetical protein RvY_19431 [Ramazzottius varieornatus]|uniref:Uncharacterized protein n=1 Tax=Ramazzottius varieornatus TaxID=947166 RepID=A0A1D1W985_RAMVA|nr:hypothetical protein RvY_19386 [Ramazzottius varieornatus]GAV09953.1 hypothetical protein RvY_19431 [Ramazzottius varieornatus]